MVVLKALILVAGQLSFSTLILFLIGLMFLGLSLIVYETFSLMCEETPKNKEKLARIRKLLFILFLVWWIAVVISIVAFDKATPNVESSIYLIPFDPSSIFIGEFGKDFSLDDFGGWMTAPWIHQRRILSLLLNTALFVPLGFALPEVTEARHRYFIPAVLLFLFAAGIEIYQFVTLGASVYSDDVIMRFIGALIGSGLYRLLIN